MNIKLKWWQVLGFFAVFAGVIWFRVNQSTSLAGADVEDRINELRRNACACSTQECANEIAAELSAYLKSIEGREFSEEKIPFLKGLTESAAECITNPAKRKNSAGDQSAELELLAAMAGAVAWQPEVISAMTVAAGNLLLEKMESESTGNLDEMARANAVVTGECIATTVAAQGVLQPPALADEGRATEFLQAYLKYLATDSGQAVLTSCLEADAGQSDEGTAIGE